MALLILFLVASIFHTHAFHFNRLQSSNRIHVYSLLTRDTLFMKRDTFANEDAGIILDDFSQIVESIQLYQRLFGETKIPSKFEVPAENPWPFHLHGLRLGKRLEKLSSSSEFLKFHPEKVEALKKVGFDPTVKNLVDDWDILLETLQAYKRIYGDLRVTVKFVVPDNEAWPRLSRNSKLGLRVASIRSAGRYVKDHPERKAILDEMGFEWKMRENTHKQQINNDNFDKVYEALVLYKEIVDDDLEGIPVEFVVPSESPWPEHLWSLKLGVHVQSFKSSDKYLFNNEERAKKLLELGIDSSPKSDRVSYTKRRFDTVYDALVVYKQLHGDLVVPQSFVVPASEPWPEHTWDLKLGVRVSAIRCQGVLISNSQERRDMLTSLGFVWEMQSPASAKKRKMNSAEFTEGDLEDEGALISSPEDVMDKEKRVEENLAKRKAALSLQKLEADSRTSLSVPLNEPFAPTTQNSRRNMKFELTKMFEPNPYREIASEAIREYMKGREYSDDPTIRRKAHFEGYLTAYDFNRAISFAINPDDVTAMKTIGYRMLEFGRFNWNKVVEALAIYKSHHGHIDVPIDFHIDDSIIASSVGFDESFEGLMLGEAVESLRIGDVDGLEDPVRKRELDALGFVWGDLEDYQRYRFLPMFIGLRLYKHLYGFSVPHSDFVVPDEPQWPCWMANMPLGEWAAAIRVQQEMVASHYPDRKDLLDALDFLWWIPPGKLPSKYYSHVLSSV